MRTFLAPLAVAAALVSAAVAAPLPGDLQICGAPHTLQEAVFLHQQRAVQERKVLQRGAPRYLERPAPRSVANGDIAIIEATQEIVARPNPIDISNRRIVFSPGEAGTGLMSETWMFDPAAGMLGVAVDLADDFYVSVTLPFPFPYYGETYDTAFVHSDGNVTFLYPEYSSTTRNFSRASSGPPRIAPLFRDLDPSVGGEVRLQTLADRVIVTWFEVPEFVEAESPEGRKQTFTVELAADGRIEFRYGSVDADDAVVGIFPGEPSSPFDAVDWTGELPETVTDESIVAEVFIDEETLDEFAIAHAFYRDFEDAYDGLVVFNDLELSAGQFSFAHAFTVRNEVRGIGELIYDSGPVFGSERRLSSFVNMGPLSNYPANPLATIESVPNSSMLTVVAHEVGHRYLAYAFVEDPLTGRLSNALLGRQNAHWSFFFNSDASVLEGNAIRDNGPSASPRFSTFAASQTYSSFDQYLMGFREASEVAPTFMVENPTGGIRLGNASRSPEVGVQFDGQRREVRIEELIEAMGERRPEANVAQRHFRHAFVLVVEDAENVNPQALTTLQRLRTSWGAFFRAHLESRATTESGLVKMMHLSTWPAAGVVKGSEGAARIEIRDRRETDLTISLTLQEALAVVPTTVVLPAGETSVDFPIQGHESGVTTLVAQANEAGYDHAETRLVVRSGLEGLVIERLHPPVVLGPDPDKEYLGLPFRVVDENFVHYSGVKIVFEPVIADAEPVDSVKTGPDGMAEAQWTLAAEPVRQVIRARLAGLPDSEPVSTEVVQTGVRPMFDGVPFVNAASGVAPSTGEGFAPGGLVTIRGQGLATEAVAAQTKLVPSLTTLPTTLGNATVYVGGLPAPLVRVAPEAITFQLPFVVPYDEFVPLFVEKRMLRSAGALLPLGDAMPGIFPDRISSGGTPEAPSPPRAGAPLLVYATGLGTVNPPGQDGMGGSSSPPQNVVQTVEAWVDDTKLPANSAQQAVFEAGVYLVILWLPEDLPPGEHRIRLTVAGVESNEVTFVTE